MMLRGCTLFLSVLLLAFAAAGVASAVTLTTFAGLEPFGGTVTTVGTYLQAGGISNNGVVVGYSSTTAGTDTSFYYDGSMHNMGSIAPGTSSRAAAINASGQITGWSYELPGGYTSGDRVAYFYNSGTFTAMPNLGRGTNGLCSGYGWGISPSGLVGGSSQNYIYSGGTLVSNLTHAMVWNSDGSVYANLRPIMTAQGLNPGTGTQQVNALNAAYAVGNYSVGAAGKPFRYDLLTGTIVALPTLSNGTNFYALGINDQNVVIGYGNDPNAGNRMFALKYNPATGTTVSLGTLTSDGHTYSRAYSINHAGDAVGTVYGKTTTGEAERAVIFQAGGGIVDLNTLYAGIITPGWTLKCATAINDNGWIAGYATNGSGETRGFLLSAVPEPSTLLLAATGLVGLVTYAWRKRK
jgi:probable HAF family extracellular repeat protein